MSSLFTFPRQRKRNVSCALIGHSYFILLKCLFSSFAHVLIGLFFSISVCFLFSSLYVLGINLLSDRQLAKKFLPFSKLSPHSRLLPLCCLFILTLILRMLPVVRLINLGQGEGSCNRVLPYKHEDPNLSSHNSLSPAPFFYNYSHWFIRQARVLQNWYLG